MNTNLPCMTVCEDKVILTEFENEFSGEGKVQLVLQENGIIMTKDIKNAGLSNGITVIYKNNEISDRRVMNKIARMKYPENIYFFQVHSLYVAGIRKR